MYATKTERTFKPLNHLGVPTQYTCTHKADAHIKSFTFYFFALTATRAASRGSAKTITHQSCVDDVMMIMIIMMIMLGSDSVCLSAG